MAIPYAFGVRVPSLPGAYLPAALGADATLPNRFTKTEVGKAVKVAAGEKYILAADGDDLEGVVDSLMDHTVRDGFSFGSVKRYFTECEAEVIGTTLAVGAQVICGAQAAIGTAHATGNPRVKAGTGALFKWRVVSLMGGNGSAGTAVLIEPIKN